METCTSHRGRKEGRKERGRKEGWMDGGKEKMMMMMMMRMDDEELLLQSSACFRQLEKKHLLSHKSPPFSFILSFGYAFIPFLLLSDPFQKGRIYSTVDCRIKLKCYWTRVIAIAECYKMVMSLGR